MLVVVALVGERGREVNEFVETALGAEGMKRSVVVAATSDQSALARRRCAWSAMSVAEYLRDQGMNVCFWLTQSHALLKRIVKSLLRWANRPRCAASPLR